MTEQAHIAQPFKSSGPNVEIFGGLASAIVGTLKDETLRPLREKHQLAQVKPEIWYSQQKVLDFLYDIKNALSYERFIVIGMNTPGIESPVERSINDILEIVVSVYPNSHRNFTPTEGYRVEQQGKETRIICNVPYPADLSYGWVYGLVRGFLKDKAANYVVRLNDYVIPYEIVIEHHPETEV